MGFIDDRIKGALIEANGLRNRLVHHYNHLEDFVAFVSIEELLPEIAKFVGVTEQWMQKVLEEA